MPRRYKKFNSTLWLFGLYAACALIRFLLALGTTCFPTVYVDEFLYYSLGRSIITEGKLLFHGQPALYNYIVYPLMLSPVYGLFPAGTNFYRVIQGWNILVMSLSVFPIWGLCKEIFREDKKALTVTAAFMLLPDFLLGEFILSEAIIYPLFYTLLLLIYRALNRSSLPAALGIGALGALLYHTKPGAVVPAAAALLWLAGKAVFRDKSKKDLLHAAAGAAAMAAVFFALYFAARILLSYSGAFFSIYDHQMNDFKGLYMDFFFRNAALYPYYFILATGIVPVFVTVNRFSRLRAAEKRLLLLTLLCLAVTMLGAALMINRPERSNILYLRYVDMYLPLFLVFCLSPEKNPPDIEEKKPAARVLPSLLIGGYLIACTAIWGFTAGVGESHDHHFLVSMCVSFATDIKGTGNILVLLVGALGLYLSVRYRDQKKAVRTACVCFAAMMLVNNAYGYLSVSKNTNPSREKETLALQRELKGEPYLYVYANLVCDMGLDVNTNQNIAQTALYDFYNCVHANGGVYRPFVPDAERGTTASAELPDATTIILDENVTPLVHFSSAARVTYSANGNYCVARFEKGARIVDSIICNVEDLTLYKNASGILTLYNPDWLNQPIRIRMELESPQAQPLYLYNAQVYTVQLEKGRQWYEITVNQPEIGYNFVVDDADVTICHYEIVPVG